jgi:hypothetical protein
MVQAKATIPLLIFITVFSHVLPGWLVLAVSNLLATGPISGKPRWFVSAVALLHLACLEPDVVLA